MPDDLRTRIGTLQYTSMEAIAMRWPAPVAKAIFRAYAFLTWRYIPSSRGIVAENLARVIGRPADSDLVQSATREAFQLYARYLYDTFRMRVTPKQEIDRRVRCDGLEHLDKALADGQGAILSLPHLG